MSAPLRRQSGVVVAALIAASSLTPAGFAVAAVEPDLVEPLTEAELEAETGALIGDPVGGSVSPVVIDDRAVPSERLIDEARSVVLPEPASFDVRLDELAAGRFSDGDSGSVVRVGAVAPPDADLKDNSVPGSPAAVSVSVLDQQSTGLVGGQGLAFELVRADGLSSGATVRAEIDYSSFRYLYGGDWASRLRFAWYPDCTQRQLAAAKSCGEPVWLPVENDVAAGRLFVDIPIDRAVKSFERGVVGPQVPGMTVVGDEQLGADQGGEVTWADLEAADQLPEPTADGTDEQDTSGSLARAFGRSGGFVMQSGGGGGIGAISGGQSGTSGSFTATGSVRFVV